MKDPMETFALPDTVEAIQDKLRVLESTAVLIAMQLEDTDHRKQTLGPQRFRQWRVDAQTSLSYTHQEIAFLKDYLRKKGVAEAPVDPQAINTVIFHLCRICFALRTNINVRDREHLKAAREYLRSCGLPILPEWEDK